MPSASIAVSLGVIGDIGSTAYRGGDGVRYLRGGGPSLLKDLEEVAMLDNYVERRDGGRLEVASRSPTQWRRAASDVDPQDDYFLSGSRKSEGARNQKQTSDGC